MRLLDTLTHAVNMNLEKLQEMVRDGGPGVLQSMGPQRVGHDWTTEQQQKDLSLSEEIREGID